MGSAGWLCSYTEVGFRNLQHWIHAGFDNMLYTPNGKVHRKLTQLAVSWSSAVDYVAT
jgi:hypothetical protein